MYGRISANVAIVIHVTYCNMVDRQYKSSGAPIVKGNQPRDTGSNEASGLKTKCSPAKDVRTRGPYSVTK